MVVYETSSMHNALSKLPPPRVTGIATMHTSLTGSIED
jgi:hypothetical protein